MTHQHHDTRNFLVVIGLMAAALAVWAILYVVVLRPSSSPTSADGTDAKIICKDFVTDRLKAPASANFQPYSGQQASKRSDGSFVINGYVDSQNAFGANLRTTYTCTVRSSSSGDWTLVSLTTSP